MSENLKRICIITGAAGHLGSTILRDLKDTDVQIRALILPNEKPLVTSSNISYYKGDVTDKESLRPLFLDIDPTNTYVIHMAAIISIDRKITPLIYNVNVGGTKNMVDLSVEYHIKKFIHVSSVHSIPELKDNALQTEISFYDPFLVKGAYSKTKAEAAEYVLDQVRIHGLDATIILPSGIIGPYDLGHNFLSQTIINYLQGKIPASVKGGYNFVDVRDVAKAIITSLDKGKMGESYLITGAYSSITDILTDAANIYGIKPPKTLPMWLAKFSAPILALIAKVRRVRPLYTSYALDTLKSNANFSSMKAQKNLDFNPRPITETLLDMIKWLKMEKVLA